MGPMGMDIVVLGTMAMVGIAIINIMAEGGIMAMAGGITVTAGGDTETAITKRVRVQSGLGQ